MSDADELRNLIAETLYDRSGESLDSSDWLSKQTAGWLANAVVDLFDLVEVQHTDRGHCYVARTKEEETT